MIMPAVLGDGRCLAPGTLRITIALAVAFNATAFARDSQKRETTFNSKCLTCHAVDGSVKK